MRLIRRMIPVCAAVVMAVVASACNRSSQTMPREFGPLVLGSTASCPVVSGRYFESEGPINDLLFLSNVLDAPNDADRAWVELAGMADTGVAVTVMYRDSTVRYGSLRKGDQWSGDYFCEDGWLKVSDRRIPGRWDRDITDADFQPRRRAFWLAPNADGGLVGRLQFIAFDAIDSWCPSGCEGIPIPGTFQYRDAWSLAERFDPGLPPRLRGNERPTVNVCWLTSHGLGATRCIRRSNCSKTDHPIRNETPCNGAPFARWWRAC